VAYRAEIEIGVKGVQQLTQLQKRLEGTAYKIEEINKKQATVFGGLAQSIKNYTRQLNMAEEALFNVAAGTAQETRAVRNYVDALGNANAIRARQNDLIRDEIELKRQAALASKGIRETTQYAGPIGPGQASSILGGQSMPAGGRIQRILNARQDELKLQEALLRLEEKSAAELNEKVQAQQNLVAGTQEVFNLLQRQAGLSQYAQPLPIPGGLKTEQVLAVQAAKRTENLAIEQRLQRTAASTVTQYNLQLGILRQMAEIGKKINESTQQELVNQRRLNRVLRVRQGREFQRRRREATGSAIIGGAFPLLFGQGIGAAAGGGLGGAAGGAIGGQFGFGLSLVGTAAGQAVDNFINNVKTLGESLKDPTQTLTALEEAGFAVDDSVKQTVEQLLKANKIYEAQTVALQQITDTLGPGSVELLNAYEKESKKLNGLYQDLSASITRSFLPALVGAIAAINDLSAGTKDIQVPKDLLKFLSLLSPSGLILSGPATLLEQRGRQAAEEAGRPDAPDNTAATEAAKKAREIADQLDRQAGILRDQVRLAELNGNLTNERVFDLRKSIIYQEAALELAKDGLTTKQRAVIELQRELKLQNLLNERVDQGNRAREDAARKAESAARKAEQAIKKERETLRAIAQLSVEAIDASVVTAQIDKGRLGAIQRELMLLQRRKEFEEEAIILSGEDARIQEFKFSKLDQEYRNKERLLKLEQARLIVSREQQILDTNRARRNQLEGIQQESSRFVAQLIDPFNTNPEALQIREREINSLQILRTEREKLQDLEREGASIRPFASAEEVKQLAKQIDNQKAFIPALEVELALRNELAIAASKQAAIIERYGFLANELSTAMSSAVQAVVTGTGTVEEAFATMFQNIGRAFIDMATQMLAQQLFMTVLRALGGGGPLGNGVPANDLGRLMGPNPIMPRANGGPVGAGQSYIVGERGPELFVPSRSGSIVPNDRLGGGDNVSVVVNVDAKGTSVQGNDQEGNQLGRVLSAAIKAELIKQKRPGGLLA
jgi:hypothetical protein